MFVRRRSFPKSITLDISGSCNLDCVMCSLKDNYKTAFMSRQTFENVLPYLSRVEYVDMNCNAEPLMNKDIWSFISDIKKNAPNTRIGFPTNGSLLTNNSRRRLVEERIDLIRFSVDGSTEETFNSIRKNADFDKVISNIKSLQDIKQELGSDKPQIVIVFVAMKQNIKELSSLIRLAVNLEVKHVSVLGLEPYSEDMVDRILYSESQTYKKYFEEAKKLALQNKVELQLPNLSASQNPRCMFKDNLYVTADGSVCPCPLLTYDRSFYYFGKKMKHEKLSFGNINNKSLEEIWNSGPYRRFRKNLHKKKFFGNCEGCLMNKGFLVSFDSI